MFLEWKVTWAIWYHGELTREWPGGWPVISHCSSPAIFNSIKQSIPCLTSNWVHGIQRSMSQVSKIWKQLGNVVLFCKITNLNTFPVTSVHAVLWIPARAAAHETQLTHGKLLMRSTYLQTCTHTHAYTSSNTRTLMCTPMHAQHVEAPYLLTFIPLSAAHMGVAPVIKHWRPGVHDLFCVSERIWPNVRMQTVIYSGHCC